MGIEEKIEMLKELKNKSIFKSGIHKKEYNRLKKYDDIINIITSFLNAVAIILIVTGFTVPPCIIASGALSGLSFIITSIQNTYNLQDRYMSHRLSSYQYKDLSREINIILLKNHMNSNEYDSYNEYIISSISLIEDTEI